MALGGVAADARILAIGDSLYHDIGGAVANGFSSLFITSGIHSPELEATHGELEPLYAQYGATPTYVLRDLVW